MQRELGASAEASKGAENEDRLARIEEQVSDLQVRFSFLDDGMVQRDNAVWELLRRIQKLEEQLAVAESKIAKMSMILADSENLPIGGPDEVPPHY